MDPLAPLRPRIQSILDTFLADQRVILAEASPDLDVLVDVAAELLAGGKRLRPGFCYWSWRAIPDRDGDESAVLTAASALELFQAAALVHDDLIDASDTRRGNPAVHRRFEQLHREAGWAGSASGFGMATAILLGDLLLGWSDELFQHSGLAPAPLARCRPHFDRMRTEVGAGQYLDVLEQASSASRPEGRVERARQVIQYKAGRYSVQRPLLIGAATADATDAVQQDLTVLGRLTGEAFQLRDDILGVFGDPETTGKPAGDDLREGKRTVLVAHTLDGASPTARAELEQALADGEIAAGKIPRLQEIIVEAGALERVEAMVGRLSEQAAQTLTAMDVTEDGREALQALVDRATHRTA